MCLHIATRRRDIRPLELLLKAGLDIDVRGDMGATALHCARTQETADALVTGGASVSTDELARLPLEVTRES